MNLAISNIAWDSIEDDLVYGLMKNYGFEGLEVAPTRVWKQPSKDIGNPEIDHFLAQTRAFGIRIIAFQALLFGRPDLRVFESKENRQDTLTYLKSIIRLAGRTGAGILIFGSPKNRDTGNLSQDKAFSVACDFFYGLGDYAYQHKTILCIEPNPREYNTNFINNTEEALRLVKEVNHPGFRLHIDTGTLLINQEQSEDVIRKSFEFIAHYHVSEPFLEPVIPDKSVEFHRNISVILKDLDYKGWISIEMKKNADGDNIPIVEEALPGSA